MAKPVAKCPVARMYSTGISHPFLIAPLGTSERSPSPSLSFGEGILSARLHLHRRALGGDT
jgi:hypothetical protein